MLKNKIQVISGAMMIPIILLVVAGVFIGIGSAFVNMENVAALGLAGIIKEGGFLHSFFRVINDLGFMVMRFLPIFFAVGIAFGLSKKEKGWGAFGGLVMYIALNTVISTILNINGLTAESTTAEAFMKAGFSDQDALNKSSLYTTFLGIFTYNFSIFGSIISGAVASAVHNKFCNQELPNALSFFSGPRFSIMMMFVFSIPLGLLMYFIWPYIGNGLAAVGGFIGSSGLIGTFTFGALDKALLPIGIHHLIAFPIEYTSIGGVKEIGGKIFEGVNNIKLAQMGDPNTTEYITRNFSTGRILNHFGALPGIGLAIYVCAKPENRKRVLSILIPAILTAMLVGVTEPIEYTFLFVAPLLYFFVYVPMNGLAYVLTEAFHVSIMGESFRNMFPNFLQPDKVSALPLLFLIPLYFALFFFVFRFLIKKFNIKTPGRGDEEVKFFSKKDYKEKKGEVAKSEVAAAVAQTDQEAQITGIIAGLGGAENIENVTNCATRLRVELKDSEKTVSDNVWLNELGAIGVVRKTKSIQVIYGAHVIILASKVKDQLGLD
ncbi:PTS transporter subunit EIIC [Neobacillus rhizosphaerae]|uniref:PTS transporter subunit EIIC n=1 Tax=Neobacillus rhizosphaerae TaxID=2880965 RepID=UPI00200C9F82|nr:PTS transporter subunit EIIC [Neobacillus rhizosphaerae]